MSWKHPHEAFGVSHFLPCDITIILKCVLSAYFNTCFTVLVLVFVVAYHSKFQKKGQLGRKRDRIPKKKTQDSTHILGRASKNCSF